MGEETGGILYTRIRSVFKKKLDDFHVAVGTGVVKWGILFDGRLDVRVRAAFTEDLDDVNVTFESGFVKRRPPSITLDVDSGPSLNEVSYMFSSALGSSLMQRRFTGFGPFIYLGVGGL